MISIAYKGRKNFFYRAFFATQSYPIAFQNTLLDSHSKQASDEYHLFHAVSLFYASDLTFPEHVHHFLSMQGSPRGPERKGAHPELDEPFYEVMILLDEVVEVCTLTQYTGLGENSVFL